VPPEVAALAQAVGQAIVEAGCVLVCGGMGGVMEAAAFGGRRAREAGAAGVVLGILPTDGLDSGNPHCDLVVPTGMGIARNVVVVRSADAVILVGGGSGTLSEAAYAWQLGTPLVALTGAGGWADRLAGGRIDERRQDAVISTADPREAVSLALARVSR
jgi:uncharacterized protein (TIGR00725 family)